MNDQNRIQTAGSILGFTPDSFTNLGEKKRDAVWYGVCSSLKTVERVKDAQMCDSEQLYNKI